mgnify:CR=1 FL=1|jgi:hypothetical protein
MAKGRDKHHARLNEINLLGKDLARRAGRACELCEARDDCRPHDLEPDADPTLDTLVLCCAPCRTLVARPKARPAEQLRFLENRVWTDVAPVRRLVVEVLEQVDEPWAAEAIANAAMMG